MVDIDKQIAYWRGGAEEDWAVAQELLSHGRVRHCLFFAHLDLEKGVEGACVQPQTGLCAAHSQPRASGRGSLISAWIPSNWTLLADMNEFNLEGRYPDQMIPTPTLGEAEGYMRRAEEVVKCLLKKL